MRFLSLFLGSFLSTDFCQGFQVLSPSNKRGPAKNDCRTQPFLGLKTSLVWKSPWQRCKNDGQVARCRRSHWQWKKHSPFSLPKTSLHENDLNIFWQNFPWGKLLNKKYSYLQWMWRRRHQEWMPCRIRQGSCREWMYHQREWQCSRCREGLARTRRGGRIGEEKETYQLASRWFLQDRSEAGKFFHLLSCSSSLGMSTCCCCSSASSLHWNHRYSRQELETDV